MSYITAHDDFDLVVRGRIDGVMVKEGQVVVEEIKTTRAPLKSLETNAIHWGQLQCYAYMWAVEHEAASVDLHLTYVHLGGEGVRTDKRHYLLEELAQIFDELITQYMEWITTITQWGRLRDATIHRQPFPFDDYRAGQREMAKAVYRVIRDKGHLLVQAATGIGKTMAALFPAIKALGEGLAPKVIFLTARTTGRLAAESALVTLRATGLHLRSVTVTAKDKVCPHPQSTCTPEECPCAKGHYDRINGAIQSALSHEALTREVIEGVGNRHQVCPFELTLELVDWADCIIGDYNYAFAPGVVLQRLFGDDADQHAVLVDEAHNLVDRSREMFSAHLSKQSILSLRRQLKETLPGVYKSLGRVNAWMATIRRSCREKGEAVHIDNALPVELLEKLQDFMWGAERWLMRNEPGEFRQELLELFFACLRFLRVAEGYDERYVTTYEAEKAELRIKLYCVDPSHLLQKAWGNCRSAVLFSATLTPVNYFQDILGCDAHAGRLNLPSPFPAENFGVYAASTISTYYRDRKHSCPDVSGMLEGLVRHRKGHYLLFFPSYAYMQMVHEQFSLDCPDIKTMVQTPEMSESDREMFLGRLCARVEDTLAGFAVLGGIFGEGIDLKGDHLSGAAIVGVGLPGICPERDVIRDYYDRVNQQGFAFAYQYPGINRVLQAAGRVIRSGADLGVVLLIDSRYGRYDYGCFFPIHWQVCRVHSREGLTKQLSKFWNHHT